MVKTILSLLDTQEQTRFGPKATVCRCLVKSMVHIDWFWILALLLLSSGALDKSLQLPCLSFLLGDNYPWVSLISVHPARQRNCLPLFQTLLSRMFAWKPSWKPESPSGVKGSLFTVQDNNDNISLRGKEQVCCSTLQKRWVPELGVPQL